VGTQDAIATTAIETVGAATDRLSVHRFVGPKRIKRDSRRIRGWRRRRLFFHLLDRFNNHAKRLAGLELVLNLDKS
jgi:hypothetical protein